MVDAMFTVEKITQIVEGELLRSESISPLRAIHDSRLVQPGDLFVALPGRRSDGHRHIGEAFDAGACAVLASNTHALPSAARNVIVVKSPALALQQLAAAWRDTLDATFIAVTGSNGKTTVKALLGHLLARTQETYVAPGNYNTEIGLPIALLAMPPSARCGVFELGAEQPGDIATLANILKPHIGVISSVGPSHLDGFETIAAVVTEKCSLAEALPTDGTIVINANSPLLLDRMANQTRSVISAGLDAGDIRGHVAKSVPSLTLVVQGRDCTIDCPLVGEHNAVNVLLAAATAHLVGMDWPSIAAQAASFQPIPHRLTPIESSFGTILDDTYNANPASMIAALRVLSDFGDATTKRVFVFGDMLGLGIETDAFHRSILRQALELSIDAILPVGERARAACMAVNDPRILRLPRDGIVAFVREQSTAFTVFLVKGSRALHLETLVEELAQET